MQATDLMMNEIKAQAELFDRCSTDLIGQARALVRSFDRNIDKVFVTGCGDSYFAGIACREAFLRLAKLPCQVHQAMEFSRYICPVEVDSNSLVLTISASGKVARTRECALRASQVGAISVAVTSNNNTPVAKVADRAFVVDIPNVIGMAPGTRSYCASQLALICMAIALGQERKCINEAHIAKLLSDIAQIGRSVTATVDNNSELISKYVDYYFKEGCANMPKLYHILGSGPNSATAQFGSMKLLESCSFTAIPTGIEEWAHSQYFTTDINTHVIFVAPKGESRDRALEVLKAVSVVDGKSIVICQEDDHQLRAAADISFCISTEGDIAEWLSHLIYAVPLEMLALALSKKLNRAGLDFINRPWLKEENFRQIYSSKVRDIHGGELDD